MKHVIALAAALALAACTDTQEKTQAANDATPLPTAEEVDAIDAAAEDAAAEITEANADATLEELEEALSGEEDQEQ